MIIEFVNQNYTGSPVKFNFIHNNEYEITNSAYSFSLAYEFIKGNNFIHMNCDNIVTSDLIKKLIKSEHVNCIITRKQKLTDNMEQVSVEGERILKMKNISFKEARLKAMGVAKITPKLSEFLFAEISREIEEEERNGNFYGAIRNAIDEFDIFSLNSTENIFEVNDIDQLNEANIVIGEKISS
jgi:choline kinase